LKGLFVFAWPVAIAVTLNWIQSQSYRYLAEGQLGLAPLGLFVAGYGIAAGLILGFESVFVTYFQPRFYHDVNSNNPAQRSKAWRNFSAAIIPPLLLTTAFTMALAPELTQLFLGTKYQSAAEFVVWGTLVEMMRVFSAVYAQVAHAHMQTRWLIAPSLAGALLSVALCIAFIPALGAVGIGVALASSGFATVLSMRFLLGEKANGGFRMRSVALAVLSALGLFLAAHVARGLLDTAKWWHGMGVIALTGIAYLGLLYRLARNYAKNHRVT
jgi:O-antigen/teichoic acid export membrane protein